jgi:hypothetical protein
MISILRLGSVLSMLALMACGGGGAEPAAPKEEPPASSGNQEADEMAKIFIGACEGKAEGDACEATMKEGENEKKLQGKCVKPPAESAEQRIVCLPNELPQ